MASFNAMSTRLQMLLMSNNVDGVAKALKENPALVNQSLTYDQTPLHFAASEGSLDMCMLLLSHSANVSTTDSLGLTPLHSACCGAADGGSGNHIKICEELISRGAAVNAQDNDGDTPLHSAVEADAASLVKILLAHGARFDITNKMGLTAPQFAEMLHRTKICKAFPSRGGSSSSKKKDVAESTFNYLFYEANKAVSEGDYAHASSILEDACKKFPNQAELFGLRALVHEGTGNFQLAKKDYERAHKLDGTSTVRLINHAKLLEAKPFCDYAGAEHLYLEAIALDPTHAAAMAELGDMYETMEELPKAKQMYEQALAVDPGNSLAYRNSTRLKFTSAMRDRDLPAIDELIAGMRALKPTGDSFIDGGVKQSIQAMLNNRKLVVQGTVLFPCEMCGTHANLKCSRCSVARYCGRDCQVAHWKSHMAVCGKAAPPRAPYRAHFGKWGCPDCGVPCTCEGTPHNPACVHAICNNSNPGAVCPGTVSCIWLNCCESDAPAGLCNGDLKTAKHSARLLKYHLKNRPVV